MTTIHNHLLPLKLWTAEDSNVMAKLKLKRLKKTPTHTEIRQNLGPRLADAVFSSICPVTKTLSGLGKALDGPGDELWSQPKRQLLGEIVLEQFPSRRHRQALTHQAILDYGEKCMAEWEENVLAQKEIEMKEKLKELEEEMTELMETRINQIRTKEREDFLIRIAMMEERLETRHQKEMEALERKLIEEKDAKVAEVIETMNKAHQNETNNLLEASKTLLTNRFHFKINWIKADLEEDFNNKLKSQTKQIEMSLKKKLESNNSADLKEMKNQMLQNVVCTACLTADYLLKEFQRRIESSKKEIDDLYNCNICLVNEIERLEKKNEICSLEVKSWECVIRDVVNQFQKFIEFQLKLPKGEVTHLISWEKVVEKKNDAFNKALLKLKPEKIISTELKSAEVDISDTEKSSTFSTAGLCVNRDIISIISSIIRRVIPSVPDLAETENEVNSILESIIRRVIPSSDNFVNDLSANSHGGIANVNKQFCPTFQRTSHEDNRLSINKESTALLNQSNVKTKSVNTCNADEQLQKRIDEITKIMDLHPNIMKYIHGP